MDKVINKQFYFHTISDKTQRRAYIQNTILDAVIFSEFFNCLDEVELVYLSLNPTLTSGMIKKMFETTLDNVIINLLKNRRCPLIFVEEYLSKRDKIFNISLAHNTALSLAQYYKLFSQMDLDVNISLAFNPNCPKDIIKELFLLHNTMIDQALCSNPNTPYEVLEQFLYDTKLKGCLTQNSLFQNPRFTQTF